MYSLENSIVYDIETFPNVFTFSMEFLKTDQKYVWEISEKLDERGYLLEFLQYLARTKTFMIGFNNEHFDYVVTHLLFHNPQASIHQLYSKAMEIINGFDRFGNMVWASDRFAPQVDLFKIYHFDNVAKRTSLKNLQINMRSPNVVDMPVEVGTHLNAHQIDNYLKPYNCHDTAKTKEFALFGMRALEFRLSLIEEFGPDVMCWNDTKIGEKKIIAKLGDELCYDRSVRPKRTIQTPRSEIRLNDVIFPYIHFNNPEFNRILNYLKQQTLRSEEIKKIGEPVETIKTKGVFKGLQAHVGGVDFHYGTGGLHGSLKSTKIVSTEDYLIRDIDVASLYPSIAIVNKLSPEHLKEKFVDVYAQLPKERKEWQKLKGKKCVEANSIKLAANGAYGKSNSVYSPLYDPQFTMTITVNGQLLLSMLIEKLSEVPTLKLIQANTDGITYYIHKNYEPQAAEVCKEWERYTCLVLEDVDYNRMWIRDVNSYIAEDKEGNLKLKGAYWFPDPLDYHNSIDSQQPPAWHKNLSNQISIRAAVAHMVHGVDVETFIRMCRNPYDFMCAVKVGKSDHLMYGENEVQRTTRYYVSSSGFELVKHSPPAKGRKIGTFKKANGISDKEYNEVMKETGGQWDERVCTKNKSTYEIRKTSIVAGHLCNICNLVDDFDFSNVNYNWYVAEAHKLIV